MVFQGINRIVSGANHFNVGVYDQVAGTEAFAGQLGIGFFPDGRGILLVQHVIDAEEALQLQV
ncbi:hypothetical protein D3C75_1211190 [compost metagenome]